MPLEQFEQFCQKFSSEMLPSLIRPKAIEEIKDLQQKNVRVVIVSASPENWIKGWANKMNVELIATRLELNGNYLTGRIYENNCHGEEKVRRINSNYKLKEYEKIFAYGDTSGDKPMLALANTSYYKPFR